MLPPALIVWFATGYGTQGLPATDQVDAASLLIGFEMFLFVAALIATFIAIAIREGRASDDARG